MMKDDDAMPIPFQQRQLDLARKMLPEVKFVHSVRVGELAARQGADYAAVGLLHDILEDSAVSEDELRAEGVSAEELTAICLLTRGPEPYQDYIATVAESANRLAISVKICDLLDHLDPALNAGLDRAKQDRYLAALPSLLTALRAIQ